MAPNGATYRNNKSPDSVTQFASCVLALSDRNSVRNGIVSKGFYGGVARCGRDQDIIPGCAAAPSAAHHNQFVGVRLETPDTSAHAHNDRLHPKLQRDNYFMHAYVPVGATGGEERLIHLLQYAVVHW
jgi:hypothetical protein